MQFRFEDNIILENANLQLRPIAVTDMDNLLSIAVADKKLLQYSPVQVYTKELLAEYIERAIAARAEKMRYTFSIYSKELKRYAGSTAFMNVSNPDDRLEIGATWIDKTLHGTGINRQCKYLMLQYAFDTAGANRIEFKTDERNNRSRKAIEKIGGKYEGILRQHTLLYDGFRRNTVCYSILKQEWDSMKAHFIREHQ